MASFHLWHHPLLSQTFSIPFSFLPLSSEAVTDHHWNINQRKCSVNGRKLRGNSVHGGLCHVTQQQAPLVCVSVFVSERKRHRICIANHPAPELPSGVYNKSKAGPKQSGATSSWAKIMKPQHDLQLRDDIYEDQNAKYDNKMPL